MSREKFYKHSPLLVIFFLGVLSGLPFLLTLSTLSFWLAEVGVSKTAIGLFVFVSLPYSLKFLWAPLIDQYPLPYLTQRLGRRRSWALLSQIGLILSLICLGLSDPGQSLWVTAVASLCVSFCAATQDIVIDAYRIETLSEKNCGSGAAMESIGFRFGMAASGAGALYLAHLMSWQAAYFIMAVGVSLGMLLILIIAEPSSSTITSLPTGQHQKIFSTAWFRSFFLPPWKLLWQRKELIYIAGFILFFKIADTILNAMAAPFLCDLGFSKIEYASITKIFGITLMVVGGLAGGYLINQLGCFQAAIMCAALQALSCLMFVIQSLVGYNIEVLIITIGVESFCSGSISAVFIACLSLFCRQPFTASHFTIFYSFGSLCRVVISALSGWAADQMNWTPLFLLSSLAAFPAIFCIVRIFQYEKNEATEDVASYYRAK